MRIPPGQAHAGPTALRFAVSVLLLTLPPCSPAALSADSPGFDCVIMPYTTVDVSSAVPGVLEAVHLDRSDPVEEGQVVAQLDSGVERAAVALARERSAMESEIHLQEASLAFAERERERLSSLHAKKAISAHDWDKAKRDAALSNWKLREARDVYRLRQLELRKAEEVLGKRTVLSPIKGVVVQRFKSPGEYVEDQPILRIAQLDPLNVEAIVPMDLFGRIRVGMQGEVVPETAAKSPYRATVTVVDRIGNAASGTFGVRLELPNPEHQIPAGQKCVLQFLADAPPVADNAVTAVPGAGEAGARGGAEPGPGAMDTEPRAEPPADAALERKVVAAGPVSPPAQPSAPEPPTCLTMGPIDDAEQAELLSVALYEQGFQVSRRKTDEAITTGYIVLTRRQETREAARQLAKELKDGGVRDIQRLSRGNYANRIALGVFRDRTGAERRAAELGVLGLETEIWDRSRKTVHWWLDLIHPSPGLDPQRVRETLDGMADGLELHPRECPAVLTAES
jgi:RND family efflux transporter MFP subunit